MRLDKYLVDKGYFKTRNKALTAIKNGAVLLAGSTIFKPSYEVLDSLDIIINTNLLIPYVSRGGLKLETAIKSFNLDFQNKVVLDIGSSTGGFTDCAIKHGAKLVYAVDVGTNQLDESLKSNAKVVSLENTNILSLPFFSNSIDIVLLDCSFVSVNVLLPAINNYVTENNYLVLLIKPQFEAGNIYLKNGIVKDKKMVLNILNKVEKELNSINLYLNKIIKSQIKGKDGNQEYLAIVSRKEAKKIDFLTII